MKILILTCNTGQGHNSSASAIKEALVAKGYECEVADAISFLSKSASKIIDTCFTGVYRHMPKAFNFGYSHTDTKMGKLAAAEPIMKLIEQGSKKLHSYIEDNGYTHVICVHIFASMAMSVMKKKYDLNVPSGYLPTDYTCYPFTEKTEADLYFLPHADLEDDIAAAGVPREKMVATGIPVRSDFLIKQEKKLARKKFGLPEDAKVILLMGGSMGCGPIKKLALAIAEGASENTKLLVSCGTNNKLLRKLEKKKSEKLIPFKYSNDIPTLMAASDLFITKPGGISITEAGVVGLPMLLVNVIGGCETPNFNFFGSHDYAFCADSIEHAKELCLSLLETPEKLEERSEHLHKNFYRNSAEEIAEYIIKL